MKNDNMCAPSSKLTPKTNAPKLMTDAEFSPYLGLVRQLLAERYFSAYTERFEYLNKNVAVYADIVRGLPIASYLDAMVHSRKSRDIAHDFLREEIIHLGFSERTAEPLIDVLVNNPIISKDNLTSLFTIVLRCFFSPLARETELDPFSYDHVLFYYFGKPVLLLLNASADIGGSTSASAIDPNTSSKTLVLELKNIKDAIFNHIDFSVKIGLDAEKRAKLANGYISIGMSQNTTQQNTATQSTSITPFISITGPRCISVLALAIVALLAIKAGKAWVENK